MRFIASAKKAINKSDRLYLLLKWITPLIEVLIFSFIWTQILKHFQLFPFGMSLFIAAVCAVFLCLNTILRLFSLWYEKRLLVRVFTFAVMAVAATYIVSAHLLGIDGLLSVFAETNNLLESLKRIVTDAPLSVKITLSSFVFFALVFIGAASETYLTALIMRRRIEEDMKKT
jgi:hypothetical protein